MKKNILIPLIFLFYLSDAQDVVVTLTARYNENPVNLTSILLENLTQNCKLLLTPLPYGITSYVINLSKGQIINGIQEASDQKIGLHVYSNVPGLFRVIAVLDRNEELHCSIFNLIGKLIKEVDISCIAGTNLIDVFTGSEQLYIFQVTGKNVNGCYKIFGKNAESSRIILRSSEYSGLDNSIAFTDHPGLISGFTFSPGDAVRFTAENSGMYPNSFLSNPQNMDSIIICLSAPCSGTPAVSDFDGNQYQTVLIGNQCWMRENVKSTHYSDGTPLVNGTGVGDITYDFTTKYWFDYEDNPLNSVIYGKLYTCAAIMNGTNGYGSDSINVQGICSNGWHVSSDHEWKVLEIFLGMTQNQANYFADWRGTTEGGKLKEADTIHWESPNWGATNESGFSAFAGGVRNSQGGFLSLKYLGAWWTSTFIDTYSSYARFIGFDRSTVYRNGAIDGMGKKNRAYSVRCLKD